MKLLTVILLATTLNTSAFGQSEQSQNLPPIKILPIENEVKNIYELPSKTDYEIFNSKGQLIAEGNAQFVDYTDYKSGIFFIRFNNTTKKIVKD